MTRRIPTVLPANFKKSALVGALLVFIALSPLLEHLVPASLEDSVNISSLTTLLVPVLTAFLAFQFRVTSLLLFSSMSLALGVVLSGALHSLGSSAPTSVLNESAKVFSGLAPLFLLPLAAETRMNSGTIQKFFWLMVFSAATHAGVALLQVLGHVDFTYFQRSGGVTAGRPSGGYFHPVSLAFFFFMIALFTNLLADRKLIGRFWRLTMLALSLGGVLLTTHRASLVAALSALSIYSVIVLIRRRQIRINYVAVTLVLLLGVGGFFSIAPASRTAALFSGVTDFISAETFDPSNDAGFLRGRGLRWGATIDFLREAPLQTQLFGVGYQPLDPHNDYLRFLLVNGWFGVISIGVSILLMTLWLMKRLDDSGRIHLCVLMVATAVFSITVKPSTYTYYMWLIAAFCIVLLQLYPRHVAASRTQAVPGSVIELAPPSQQSLLT